MKTKQQLHGIVTIGSKADRVTIGYRRVNRMVQVAVSYCAPDDKWKAKKGQQNVYDRLLASIDEYGSFEGVISLPMGKWEDYEIQVVLTEMFCGFRPGE